MAPRYTYETTRERVRDTDHRSVARPDRLKSWRLVHVAMVSSFVDRDGVTWHDHDYVWEHDARDDMAPIGGEAAQ